MCGIAGIFALEGEVDREILARMQARLGHRGPDGQGITIDGRVGLAHTRLSIIDLEHGHQPLFDRDQRLALVANGEIYNHVELREQLQALGHAFATRSDCEPVLAAWREYGRAFVKHLHGMFALALHDRDSGELILARDRLGIKPLFVCRRPEAVYFASEIKALLAALPGNPEIDPLALAAFAQMNFASGRQTVVAGIERVLPGEMLRIDADGRLTRETWWSLSHVRTRYHDFDEAAAVFDDLLASVIPQHLRSDVPWGLFLSGGVDSSVLLALLDRYAGTPLHSWSVGFPGSSVHNELDAATALAQRFGTRHTVLEPDAGDLLARLPACVWAADELMGDYANLPVDLLARHASQSVKVVFSGEGGDEVFAGYGRYRQAAVKRWLSLLRHPRRHAFRSRGILDPLGNGLLQPRLAEAMRHWRDDIARAWAPEIRHWSRLQHMQHTDLRTWLPDDLLVKADRMLMRHGVEGRVPFLDHRIVEFGLSLADDLKIDGRNGKVFLKRWAERLLPKASLWSRKKGFTVPVRDWLRGPLLDRLQRSLPHHPALTPWFRPRGIERLLDAQRRHGRHSQALWIMLHLVVWHGLFPGCRYDDPDDLPTLDELLDA